MGLLLPCSAASAVAEPGNAAENQYTETVPTSNGETPSRGVIERPPGKVLGHENASRLNALGADGRAAAALAATVAPPAAVSRRSDPTALRQTVAERRDLRAVDSPSGVSEVASQVLGGSGSGEMGIAMPLLCLGAIVGSIVYLGRRWCRVI